VTVIRILIVDDHIVVRLGLRTLIQSQPDMDVAADVGTGSEALDLFAEAKPDITLLDLRMPQSGGIEVLRQLRLTHPGAKVLMLSSFGTEEDIYRALQAGAAGYILKDAESDDLLAAIRCVHGGGNWIPPGVAERYAHRMQQPQLTNREMEILKCIFKGLSNKEIAYELHVAENTVKNHVNNLMCKLGAKDRTQATRLALLRGLLSVE
jgi:two-component system, NarL family, response regulator